VKRLVHDEKSHAVAEIQEVGRRRIVRGADSVDAELPQFGQAMFPHADRHRSAERSAIVMQAHALEYEIRIVQPETAGRLEPGVADSESDRIIVKGETAGADPAYGPVKLRMTEVPESRVLDSNVLLEIDGSTGRHGLRGRLAGRHRFAVGIEERDLYGHL